MSIDLSQFHQVFFEESLEGLDVMESHLLELDCETVDAEVINTIFRAAHSIKGGSGTFGFSSITDFTHVLETLLDEIRSGERNLEPQHVDLLLQSVDCLRDMLTSLQDSKDPDTEVSSKLIDEFNSIMSKETSTSSENDANSSQVDQGKSSVSREWSIFFKPEPSILRTGNDPYRMFRELAELGELSVTAHADKLPELTSFHPEDCYLSWDLQLISNPDVEKQQIEEIFEWVVDESDIRIEEKGSDSTATVEKNVKDSDRVDLKPMEGSVVDLAVQQNNLEEKNTTQTEVGNLKSELPVAAKVTNERKSSKSANKASETTSIRVSIEKVDQLVNLVGELVITQSMLGQVGKDFDLSRITKLQEGLAQLEHNTRELQESVMRIRMLPISFTFSRFPRMVRDLCKQLNKKVELKLVGEQTELDKTVMEKIGDPLVHLVRNSLDHGLETPQQRLAAGKPEVGSLILNAYHQGGNIIIEITDDGRGLNREKIIEKAANAGLINQDDVLSDDQVGDLIFQPGFSTAEVVTDVSGRGVGMDVVRRNIQELNGSVEVKSVEGKGATFTIRLPLTMAILDGQQIRVGSQTYIVPLVSIVESLSIDRNLVNQVAGGVEVFRLRDDYIPIIRLFEIFHVAPDSRDLSEGLLVVLEAGGQKIGLVVDELLAQQQVVIKSMEANYHRVEGVSGATILGDGTVALILDISDLIKLAGIKHDQLALVRRKNSKGSQAA